MGQIVTGEKGVATFEGGAKKRTACEIAENPLKKLNYRTHQDAL